MSINRQYVTLEQAKFFKEKGLGKFNGNVNTLDYFRSKYFHKNPIKCELKNWKEDDIVHTPLYDNLMFSYPDCDMWTYAPEQWVAARWLQREFNILITITSVSQESWQWHITRPGESLGTTFEEDFNSPEDAYDSAFNYIIKNNLI